MQGHNHSGPRRLRHPTATMHALDHAPLVATTAKAASATMVSEGSPPGQNTPEAFAPQTVAERFPRWKVHAEGLVADFLFPSYMEGIDFVRQVAEIAEGMNHHPDIWAGWRRVRLTIMTHSKKAITPLDGTFVEKVEALKSRN